MNICSSCGQPVYDPVSLSPDIKHELRIRIITDPNLLPETKSRYIEWIDAQPESIPAL